MITGRDYCSMREDMLLMRKEVLLSSIEQACRSERSFIRHSLKKINLELYRRSNVVR